MSQEPEAIAYVELPVEEHEVQWMGLTVLVTGKMLVRMDDVVEVMTPDGPMILPKSSLMKAPESVQ